jgi:hypothetical protein
MAMTDVDIGLLVVPFVKNSHLVEHYLYVIPKNTPYIFLFKFYCRKLKLPPRPGRLIGLIKFLRFIKQVSPAFFYNKVKLFVGVLKYQSLQVYLL